MAVLRAVLRAVGLLVVLVLAAAVVGLAVAILAIMVMQGVEGEKRPHRGRDLVPPRRPVQTPNPANRGMVITPMDRPDAPIIRVKATSREPIPAMAANRRVNRRNEG